MNLIGKLLTLLRGTPETPAAVEAEVERERLAGRTRELALGLCALLGLVAAWALATKVLPLLYDYGPPGATRLRAPVGLWNQLALLGAVALPLALWLRRTAGTLLAYGWLVAL